MSKPLLKITVSHRGLPSPNDVGELVDADGFIVVDSIVTPLPFAGAKHDEIMKQVSDTAFKYSNVAGPPPAESPPVGLAAAIGNDDGADNDGGEVNA